MSVRSAFYSGSYIISQRIFYPVLNRICFLRKSVLLPAVIIFCFSPILQAQSVAFKHLSADNGLSNNLVNDILQDKTGFIWFATDDGLNRYDGYSFKVFRNIPEDENSISDNSVMTMIEDSYGKLWIGTKSGWLNRYDPVKDEFRKWKIKSNIIIENSITFLLEDSRKKIWIGTYRSGLYLFDPLTDEIINWINTPGDEKSISNNYISSIVEDNLGRIWVSTYNGLNVINPNQMQNGFIRFFKQPENPNSLSDNLVWNLSKSQREPDLIWIGTANGITSLHTDNFTFSRMQIQNPANLQFGNSASSVIEDVINNDRILWVDSYAGLVCFNLSKNYSVRYVSDNKQQGSISSNRINRMKKDRSGMLWLATSNGVNYASFKSVKFNSPIEEDYKILNSAVPAKMNVTAITKTRDGILWFGTEEGLYSFRKGSNPSFKKLMGTEGLNIWSLAPGNKNDLWIGTYGLGLYKLETASGDAVKVQIRDSDIRSPAVNYIKSIFKDKDENLWLGFWGVGLGCVKIPDNSFKYWLNNPKDPLSLSYNDVWVIFEDSKKGLWVGTNGGGLNYFSDKEKGVFRHWTTRKEGSVSLSSNSIYSICESEIKNDSFSQNEIVLWVGTNNGLNRLIVKYPENGKGFPGITSVKVYTVADGLAENSIKSIAEDNDGNLWLGTSSGISLFNTTTGNFVNYTNADGIKGIDFNFSSALKNDDGILLMGNTSGLNYFYPPDIKLSGFKPPLLITDFQIFNKSVPVAEKSPLKENILFTREIVLSNNQNVFSFQFAALDYASPNSIKYVYKMEGFDDYWMNSGSRRFVTYTNLNPGEYTFKVKSTNSDGVWNENYTSIKVIILPPWWQTPWAISLYVLVLILGIWGIVRFQVNRTKLRHELKMREFESHHLREIESMKSRFFTNLSHEFRTPLLLIKGPLEQLISGKIKNNLSYYYHMILRNAEKLQQLIDEMLELSQLEAETIPLHKQKRDIVKLLKSVTETFIPLAELRNINYTFHSSVENVIALFDREKLEKIISNLLSNAFKFTPDGGRINVDLILDKQEKSDVATISISDSGIGIPEEHRSKVFDRFYQIDDSSRRNYGSSGIGLALVKELVSLHNWNISVFSKVGEGTVFTLRIPVEKQTGQLIEAGELVTESLRDYDENAGSVITENNENNGIKQRTDDKPVLLLVEDSSEVRNYIAGLLQTDYIILTASGAEEGLDLALNNMPELIISDVMMEGMDGLEFCHRIKSDWQTSHIPVVLLTAKATREGKIEGLETGADDYITKPFNYDELAVRIKNLIEQRKSLREKFGKEIKIQSGSVTSSAVDKEFFDKILGILEKNLSNEEFDSEMLATEMFISRRQLHRKLMAVSGQAPGEFIRIFKLKRAAQMLIENKFGVTQIALEVGFGSPAQFSRAFKKHFGYLPSAFRDQYHQKSQISA